jgi:uncharacterized protein YlaI
MFDEHLEGVRYQRFTARRAMQALESTADGDSNDDEIQAGHDLASEVDALLTAIVEEQDPRDLLNEARAAADRMNFASKREAIAGAATLKDVLLDLDHLACKGELPAEWIDAYVKREQRARDAQVSLPPKVVGLNGDGDPVCPVCQAVDSIIATTTKTRVKRVRLFDGTVELSQLSSMPLAVTYECKDCTAVVALPQRVVDAA